MVAILVVSDDEIIGRCEAWIAEHYDSPAPVVAIIRLSGLAERTFELRALGTQPRPAAWSIVSRARGGLGCSARHHPSW